MERASVRTMQFFVPLDHEREPSLQAIEVHTSFHIPSFQIVGLPSQEVSEGRERVRSAVLASGLSFPKRRVTINLSPAHLRKRGTALDLGIALSILLDAHPELKTTQQICVLGELGLDGSVKSTGRITRALYAAFLHRSDELWIAESDYWNAVRAHALISQCSIFSGPGPILRSFVSLQNAWSAIRSPHQQTPVLRIIDDFKSRESEGSKKETASPPQSLLQLPPTLEKVIGLALAGRHHLLLAGPHGIGKSKALEWLEALAPAASAKTQLDRQLLWELGHSVNGASQCGPPAIRRVSPNARPAALVGRVRGNEVLPGEFSLAHGDWLIADEIAEWHRDCREALREPLEGQTITLTRANLGSVVLPADFRLMATANLCPCGKDLNRCTCPTSQRLAYRRRLSGPILDRIDLLWLKQSGWKDLLPADSKKSPQTPLETLREKIEVTQARLRSEWGNLPGNLSPFSIEEITKAIPSSVSQPTLSLAQSLRSRHKLVRLALTLSAWEGRSVPRFGHFSEAWLYRPEAFWNGFSEPI